MDHNKKSTSHVDYSRSVLESIRRFIPGSEPLYMAMNAPLQRWAVPGHRGGHVPALF